MSCARGSLPAISCVPVMLLQGFNDRAVERPGGSVRGERANFTRRVLGCIEASKQASKYVQSLPEKKRDPGIRAQLK